MGWLKKLVGFENNFTKNILGDIGNDPTRLITGIDPFSTKVWNGVTGTDNEPLVNAFGSPGQQYYDRAQADGIDTGPAGQFHGAADVVAGMFGANGLAGIGGAGAGAGGTGAAAAGTGGAGAGAAGGAAAGGGGLLGAIGGPSGALQLASGIGGALAANSGSKAGAGTSQMDPRVGGMLFGDGGADKGLLAGYRAMLDTPQNAGIKTFGNERDQYIGYQGSQDLNAIRNTALEQMRAGVPAPVTPASQVNAPSQNGLDLKNAYGDFINGERGANPYLTGAIAKGINQSTNAFGNMITDAKAATQDVLGSIRGGAQMAGGYGGSRQGLAEGKAIESMNTQLGRAASQFGQNNTDAAVAAQAGAYDSDSNRALAATQGLGAQQYGVASQNAQLQQQANLANNQAQQNTNALNIADRQNGVSNLSGVVSGAVGAARDQDAYGVNRAVQVNGGLLAPYLGQIPATQPTYQNTGGNLLGGAMAGLGLYNQFKQLGTSTAPPQAGGGFSSLYPAAGY